MTDTATKPTPPKLDVVTNADGSRTITWPGFTLPRGGVLLLDSTFVAYVPQGGTSVTDKSVLPPSTTYTPGYVLDRVGTDSISAPYTSPAAPPPPSGVPGAITDVTDTISGTSVTFDWTNGAATDGVDCFVDGASTGSPLGGWPNPVPTTYTFAGLTPGTHTFGFYPYNAKGSGPTTMATVVIGAGPPPPPPPPSSTLLGLWHSNGTVADAQATATALGVSAKLTAYSTYGDPNTWQTIANAVPEKTPLVLLFATDYCPAGGNDKSAVGNEAYYTTFGNNLIENGAGDTICRVAWEPNGGTATPSITSPADYIAGFRAVATGLRAAGTPETNHILIDYCCNALGVAFPNGATGVTGWNDYYPGDDVVDVISIDFYENGYPEWYVSNIMTVVSQAIAHKKPWALPEWGLSGSDVPAYIEAMAACIKGGNVTGGDGTVYPNIPPPLYHSYWSQPGTGSELTQWPNSLAAFKLAFA